MDHLPKVKLFEGAILKVPYLADRDYDGGSFGDYPQRRGWDLKRLLSRDFSEHSSDETASFLQTWLFFGILHEIREYSGVTSNEPFVTESEEGKKWIYTADLDAYIKRWVEHLEAVSGEEGRVKSSIAQLTRSLMVLHTMTNVLYGSDHSPLPDEVVLSFKVLGSTFDGVFVWLWDVQRPVSWGLKDIAASRMLSQGWCPRDVALTCHHLSEIAMLYASYIKREYVLEDHASCTEDRCAVNQIDEASYRTKHTTTDCQCGHVEPDQHQIQEILAKGQVPVVSLTPKIAPDGTKTLDVGIKGHRYLRWFVAFSHVWSDGLGNSQRNSLPMCQLQALYDIAVDRPWDEMFGAVEHQFQELKTDPEISEKWFNRVDRLGKKILPATHNIIDAVRDRRGRPISIWIDTLCVPLDKAFRKIAIAGLKHVYSSAMFTIVLDAELQRTSCICEAEENLMRIAISGWMRRAWTFQEGILANLRLRVRFADGYLDLSTLLGQENKMEDIGMDFHLTQNPKIGKVAQRLIRWADEHGGYEAEIQRRALKAAKRKENYNMSSYIIDEARTFFIYMFNVWMMPIRTDINLRSVKTDKVRRIIAAWMGLQWRQCSREEDRFIIFATACVTSIDELNAVQGLLNYPAHGRMKLWLSQQYALPIGLLFISGRRHSEEGWGWAPLDVTRDDLKDETVVDRSSKDTFFEVAKPGHLLSLPGSLTGQNFMFVDVNAMLQCIVKLDRTYLKTSNADLHPPLPPRPSEKKAILNPEVYDTKRAEILHPLPGTLSRQDVTAPPLPPRPLLTQELSTKSGQSSSSKSSFPDRTVAILPPKNESILSNQDRAAGQMNGPKRIIPPDGTMFGLVLSQELQLDDLVDSKVAGALITVSSQSDEFITGLFICSVTVEIIQTEDQADGPFSTHIQVLKDTQRWRIG